MLELELVTSVAPLSDLLNEWRHLELSVPYLTPFQTAEWLSTWWDHFGSGELRVFVFRDKSELVGLIPAFLHDWAGRSQLTLLGTGISDFVDPPVAKGLGGDVSCCLFRYLDETSEWDICNWQDLSNSTDLARCSARFHLAIDTLPDTPCSAIPIDRTFSHYWNDRPAGLRRNVRRYRQKAEQVSALKTEITDSANSEYFEALIRLHSARWREQGEPGMIAANCSAAFLRDVIDKLDARGFVRYFVLRFQDTITAVILGFEYRQTIYAYLSAFDPAYASFGFGRILLFEAIQNAFARNCKSWNFLRGNEPYKFEWGAKEIDKKRLIIRRVP